MTHTPDKYKSLADSESTDSGPTDLGSSKDFGLISDSPAELESDRASDRSHDRVKIDVVPIITGFWSSRAFKWPGWLLYEREPADKRRPATILGAILIFLSIAIAVGITAIVFLVAAILDSV